VAPFSINALLLNVPYILNPFEVPPHPCEFVAIVALNVHHTSEYTGNSPVHGVSDTHLFPNSNMVPSVITQMRFRGISRARLGADSV